MAIISALQAFSAVNINRVPESAGVYGLYDSNQSLIYYGMSEGNIRLRLMSHYNGNEGSCTKSSVFFNYEITKNAKNAESGLVASYKAAHSGRLPKCNTVTP